MELLDSDSDGAEVSGGLRTLVTFPKQQMGFTCERKKREAMTGFKIFCETDLKELLCCVKYSSVDTLWSTAYCTSLGNSVLTAH